MFSESLLGGRWLQEKVRKRQWLHGGDEFMPESAGEL